VLQNMTTTGTHRGMWALVAAAFAVPLIGITFGGLVVAPPPSDAASLRIVAVGTTLLTRHGGFPNGPSSQ
jgi:hypothetical protein